MDVYYFKDFIYGILICDILSFAKVLNMYYHMCVEYQENVKSIKITFLPLDAVGDTWLSLGRCGMLKMSLTILGTVSFPFQTVPKIGYAFVAVSKNLQVGGMAGVHPLVSCRHQSALGDSDNDFKGGDTSLCNIGG